MFFLCKFDTHLPTPHCASHMVEWPRPDIGFFNFVYVYGRLFSKIERKENFAFTDNSFPLDLASTLLGMITQLTRKNRDENVEMDDGNEED